MNKRWFKQGLLYAGIIIVAAVLGTALGDLNAARREKAQLAEKQKELQNYLKKNIQGIAVGTRFPEFTVWSSDSTTTAQTTALLAGAGVIVYLAADCQSCLDAVDNLHKAREDAGGNPVPVALLVSGNPEHLIAHMSKQGYDFPIYRDAEVKLLREHHVTAFPCFFKLTADAVVADFGAIKTGTGMFADVFAP